MESKYEVIIYWSKEDEAFLAEIPELKGCLAHGETTTKALENVNEVANEWLKIANEENWQILEPKGRLGYA
jgi:predicted RNase H-like HicB family nuclease